MLVNKRAAKAARVSLKLNAPIPAQDVSLYEYSAADRQAIGQLPTQDMAGGTVTVNLPAMSGLRFDVTP